MIDDEKRLAYLRDQHPTLWLAIAHHRNHKGEPLTFRGHSYLRQVYVDKSPRLVVQKSTQCGLTEYLIAVTMSKALIQGRSVFYVMPSYGLLSRFVKNRLDQTVEKTAIYRGAEMEAAEEEGRHRYFADSISLKRYGKGTVAFVSSMSRAGFTEFPADDVIIDELDECDTENVPMAVERLSHSQDPRWIKVGNPSYPNYGISAEYALSDRKKWHIKCESCGEWQVPDFFKNVLREMDEQVFVVRDTKWAPGGKADIRMICVKCGKPLDRFSEGEWVAEAPGAQVSGYQISKLFSTNAKISDIVEKFQKGETDAVTMQRFYNADLGLPFVMKGAKIDRQMLDDCIDQDYLMPERCNGPCVAGVDVGAVLHVRINEVLPDGKERAVYIGAIKEYEDLRELLHRYRVVIGVVDALPEIRLSRRIVQWKGWYKASFHSEGGATADKINVDTKDVATGRTEILDAVKERVMLRQLVLPKNAASLPEYYDHMQSSIRYFDDKSLRYIWQEGNNQDHFLLAEAYALLARRILAGLS